MLDQTNNIWSRWIGADGDNTSDALIPDASQLYPGLTADRNIVVRDSWHALQTFETGGAIASVFRNFWSIPERIQPVSAVVTRDGDWYTAVGGGGRPPYTYSWLWWGWECPGGGEAIVAIGTAHSSAPGRRPPADTVEAEPDAIACGWQWFSSGQQVYWRPSQRTLKVTITDTQGRSADAYYEIP